jgi:hypothetical protein
MRQPVAVAASSTRRTGSVGIGFMAAV